MPVVAGRGRRLLCWTGLTLGVLLGILGVACRRTPPSTPAPDAGPPWFADITAQSGLAFQHDAGPLNTYFMPQITGSGCALFDLDGDGRLDAYLINNGGPQGAPNRLFHQRTDGTFEDVSKGSGLDVSGYGMGVAIADVNNDGLPDVLLTEYGRIRLFLNRGGGKFQDVTREAGLDDPLWATSACFFDYDRDGWLDLVVTHYVMYDPSWHCTDSAGREDYCHPSTFRGTITRLFHNLGHKAGNGGKDVRFADVTVAAGLGKTSGPGLGVACADFDGDGWPDIFVANDGQPNRLWINQHDGTFKDEAVRRGLAYNGLGQEQANMGIALGDTTGDGLLDIFVTHLIIERHTLWRQKPRGVYQDSTSAAGLAQQRGTGWSTLLADFDQDGALDLAWVQGAVSRSEAREENSSASFWSQYAQRNRLFRNEGNGHFQDLSAANPALCDRPGNWRGMAAGDVDGDGALDLLVTEIAGPARLYRNVVPQRGHWLLVRAVDPALGGRDAYGAEVTVQAGGRRWLRLINSSQGYLSSGDPRAHFGLGKAERVDAIRVLWPDGLREEFEGVPVDQAIVLSRGKGKVVEGP